MRFVPSLTTFTGNLLAERTLEFESWSAGKTQRAVRETFQVGGKGINVSKMLARLKVPNTTLCFVGGATGAECETWLSERKFAFITFETRASTRVGTVIRAAGQPETTFLGPDVAPDADAVRDCAKFLDAQPDGQVLALCGSFPGWAGADFEPLREALARWARRGILVADTYGPPLTWLVRQPVALVKINADELRSLTPNGLDRIPSDFSVQRWIVTDGPRPVQVREPDGSVSTLRPPTVREVSPTGSGDVLFACVLHGFFHQKLALREAVSFALPYAAANAAHPGIAEFPEPAA